MTMILSRQTQSFRPVVRAMLIDFVHLLRSARGIFSDLLQLLGQWTDDPGARGVWDAHLGSGAVPAGRAVFPEHIFDWRW